MFVLGLTGGIGAGKSTVSHYLITKGFVLVDADKIARQVVEVGEPLLINLREVFGDLYFNSDGSLNRKALGALVFKDPEALLTLNAMVHPVIKAEIFKRLTEIRCRDNESKVILDAALFNDLELQSWVDVLWIVDAKEAIRLKRIIERDSLTEVEAYNRIKSQTPIIRSSSVEMVTVLNEGSRESLYRRIDAVLKGIKASGGRFG